MTRIKKKVEFDLWGKTYNRHRAKGMDHSDAAERADRAVYRALGIRRPTVIRRTKNG